MVSRIQELYIQTRNHPVSSYLIPLESVLGYPIPSLDEEKKYINFLVYQRGWAPRGTPRPVFPPHARLKIEFPSGRLIEYIDLTHKTSIEAVGEYPHEEISGLSVKDVITRQEEYYTVTELLIPLLGKSPQIQEERDTINRYKDLANTLLEPGLWKYYQELNPVLFNWLDSS